MSESRYSVTVRLNAHGRYTWTVATSDEENFPVYEDVMGMQMKRDEVTGDCRTFAKAVTRATEEVAIYVRRDLEAELVDSFESNVPIAQGGTA